MTTRTLVVLAAALEVSTGVALIADPRLVADLLLRADLSGGGIAVGRVAGLALLCLGLACWPGRDGATVQATKVMFTYNLLIAFYLGYLGVDGRFAGHLLWPAFALHAFLTLLLARLTKRSRQEKLGAIPKLLTGIGSRAYAGRNAILTRKWQPSKETFMGERPTPEHILQVGLGFWASKVLLSAVEMSVFTELARHPQDLETLSGRLGLHPRAARDFLDSLVALGFLERRDGKYSNTPDGDLFLDKQKTSYIGGILEMANHRLYGFWGHLTEALRTGKPQNEVKTGGMPLFEGLYADPARLKEFLAGMTGISMGAAQAIAAKFPWKDHATFVDVGAAQGGTSAQIALAHPHLQGTGFDLPEVGPIFEEYVEAMGLSQRLHFSPGSFFDNPIPKADVVVMGHILHDWDLDTKRMLLAKAYDAIPSGGAVIVYESIIDDDRSHNAFGLMMSLNMLVETPGGFDYTGADCQGWMRAAGFRESRVEHLVGPDSMVIGIK